MSNESKQKTNTITSHISKKPATDKIMISKCCQTYSNKLLNIFCVLRLFVLKKYFPQYCETFWKRMKFTGIAIEML